MLSQRKWADRRRQFHQMVDFHPRMDLDMVTAQSSREALCQHSTANHPTPLPGRKVQVKAGNRWVTSVIVRAEGKPARGGSPPYKKKQGPYCHGNQVQAATATLGLSGSEQTDPFSKHGRQDLVRRTAHVADAGFRHGQFS